MFNDYDEKRFLDTTSEEYFLGQIEKRRLINEYHHTVDKLLSDEELKIRAEEEKRIRREHPDWDDIKVNKKLNEIIRKRLEEYEMQLG